MGKKIAVVFNGLYSVSSIGVLFANLAEYFDSEQVSLTYLLAADPDAPQSFEDEVKKQGVRVIHLHELDRGRIIRWPWTLYRAFKQYGPFDAVHANMEFQSGIIVTMARLAGIPLRISHAHRPSSPNSNQSLPVRAYRSFMRFLMLRNAQVRLACSESAGKYFYGKGSFTVVQNGIDLAKFYPSEMVSQKETSGYRFITVGRIAPEKNPFFLLDVFEAVHLRVPKASLTWIGTGKLQEAVQKKVYEKGLSEAVTFLGQRKDVDASLRNADVFLFPSQYEAFGIALLEAQAAGLDCFASDTIPRLVDCGKCLFLSLNLSPAAWADRIISYIESGNRMILDQDKLHQFDIRVMASKLTELYVTGYFPSDQYN